MIEAPEFCSHDSGEVVFLGDGLMRCGNCHTVLVMVSQEWLERILADYRDLQALKRMEKGLQSASGEAN